uniref:(northern house mosquito) hypothetical protein n=1 Tax=Culex pipiens TaxID=7175 RepID=A0A8D8DRL4_CULPI
MDRDSSLICLISSRYARCFVFTFPLTDFFTVANRSFWVFQIRPDFGLPLGMLCSGLTGFSSFLTAFSFGTTVSSVLVALSSPVVPLILDSTAEMSGIVAVAIPVQVQW